MSEATQAEPRDRYPMPDHGWTCFHCGEQFSIARQKCADAAIKAAQEHFGATVDDEPLCRLAAHPHADLVKRVREAENTTREAFEARDAAEDEAAAAHGELRAISDRFKGARTVYDAWCMYDSMEGRALAAEQDASRYRKLRAMSLEEFFGMLVNVPLDRDAEGKLAEPASHNADALDAALDAWKSGVKDE